MRIVISIKIKIDYSFDSTYGVCTSFDSRVGIIYLDMRNNKQNILCSYFAYLFTPF